MVAATSVTQERQTEVIADARLSHHIVLGTQLL